MLRIRNEKGSVPLPFRINVVLPRRSEKGRPFRTWRSPTENGVSPSMTSMVIAEADADAGAQVADIVVTPVGVL